MSEPEQMPSGQEPQSGWFNFPWNRLERKIDHLHDMLHAQSVALAELLESKQDQGRLSAAAKELQKKTDAVKAALDKAKVSG